MTVLDLRLHDYLEPYPSFNNVGPGVERLFLELLKPANVPEWFASEVLPLLTPEQIPALMAKLTARRLGGIQPGPLAAPAP